jgi:deoxyribonuclease-4
MGTLKSLGAHTFGLVWSGDVASCVERLVERGFSCFQLMAVPPHFDPWQPGAACIDGLRRAVSQANGRVVAVDLPSSDTNLASPCKEVRDFAIRSYKSVLDIAHEVGARWVTVQSGRRHKLLAPPGDLLTGLFADSLSTLCDEAEKSGMRILLENIPGTVLETGAEVNEFLLAGDFPTVDALYDVANAWAAGEDPVRGMQAGAARLAVLHLSDCPAGQWEHAPIGSGDIDFAAIRRRCPDLPCLEEVVLEVTSADPLNDIDASRGRLRAQGWAA